MNDRALRPSLVVQFPAHAVLELDMGALTIPFEGNSATAWWNSAHDPFTQQLIGRSGYIYHQFVSGFSYSVNYSHSIATWALALRWVNSGGTVIGGGYGFWITGPADIKGLVVGITVPPGAAGMYAQGTWNRNPDTVDPMITGSFPRPLQIIF